MTHLHARNATCINGTYQALLQETVNTVTSLPASTSHPIRTAPLDEDSAVLAALLAVLACKPTGIAALRALSSTQWATLIALSDMHEAAPRLYIQIKKLEERNSLVLMPDQVREALHGRYMLALARNILIDAQTQEVLRWLEDYGVEALVLKGPTLATLLYDTPGGRISSDIDVIIRPRDRDAALLALAAHGCNAIRRVGELYAPDAVALWYIEVTYNAPESSAIDLHWYPYGRWWHRLTHPHDLWVEQMFAHSATVDTGEMRVRVPGNEDYLLFLCLHAARDNFSRLTHFADVDRFVAVSCADLDWDEFVTAATRYGVCGPIYYALWLTVTIMGTPIPVTVLEALEPPALLRRAVFRLRFGGNHTILSPAYIAGTRTQRQVPAHLMLDSYRDILRCCWIMLFPGRPWLRQRYGKKWDFGLSLIVFHLVYYLLSSLWRTVRYVLSS